MVMFGRKPVAEPAAVDRRDRAPAPVRFGFPTTCPDCRQPGFLDHIDITRKRMFQHCPACAAKWETTEAELFGEPQRVR